MTTASGFSARWCRYDTTMAVRRLLSGAMVTFQAKRPMASGSAPRTCPNISPYHPSHSNMVPSTCKKEW